MRVAETKVPTIISLASIATMPTPAIQVLYMETKAEPDPATMFMQMFHLLQALGQRELSLDMQGKALERRSHYRIAGIQRPAIRLLALMTAGDGRVNIPLEYVIGGSDILLDQLYLLPGQPLPDVVPEHDVAIVAVSQSGATKPVLAMIEALADSWPRPLLNRPRHIERCARDAAFALLNDVPGMLVPETRRLRRFDRPGFGFPITIRPVDTHAGRGLERIEDERGLDAYFEARADAEFYASQYVDYRGEDGGYRKLRVALIDRRPYACHLAIADNWIVHYKSAEMGLAEKKRDEEAAVLEGFDEGFGLRHADAFRGIADKLALDYVVLDCAESRDGRLLLFEADIAGWIHATDPVTTFPYKPKVMRKAFAAFRRMLADGVRAAQPRV